MDADAAEETVIELWRAPEVFVYKVPLLTSTHGYKAADWNLEKPQVTGSLKLLSRGPAVRVEVFDLKGTKVASCPITLDPDETKPASALEWWVEVVKDSSRYFVVRAVDPATKRQALLGVGFRERNTAFEFQSALNDHFKRVVRQRKAVQQQQQQQQEGAGEADDGAGRGAAEPFNKYQLSGRITVKLGKTGGASSGASSGEGGGADGGLAPPPGAGGSPVVSTESAGASPPLAPLPSPATAPAATDGGGGGGDVDWGDFQ